MPGYSTYDDYLNGSDIDLRKTSKNALYERGKYLVEYIDKIPNKLSGQDFKSILSNSSKNNRVVCTYGPGSGKTTALRQYIVSVIGNISKTGVISIQLVDDIHKFVYDVKSHLTYLGKTVTDEMIRAYTSSDKLGYRDLLETNWIICSHQRLLIEPSSTLYYVSGSIPSSAILTPKPRDILIIDEMPSNMFIGKDVVDLQLLLNLDEYLIGTMKSESDDPDLVSIKLPLKDQERSWIISKMIKRKIKNSASMIIQRYVPRLSENRSYNRIITDIHKMTKEQLDIEIARLCEFTNYFINEENKWHDNNSTFERLNLCKIFYTPLTFNVKKIMILDGTGDILLDHSGWKILKDNRFKRKIMISKVSLIESRVSRYQDVDSIVKSYTDILSQVAQKYDSDTQILGYLWKTKKNKVYENYDTYETSNRQEVEIVDLIEKRLHNEGIDNVKLITYKSGKEKSSNEYLDSSVAVILGKFVLPDQYVNDFSLANKIVPRLSSLKFTETLLIQFMYRTRARTGKSIDLYIDNQYSDILGDLLYNVGINKNATVGDTIYCNVPELQPKKLGPKGPNSMTPEEVTQKELLKQLDNSKDYTIDELNNIMKTNLRSDKIYNKLDKFGISYTRKGERGKPTLIRMD